MFQIIPFINNESLIVVHWKNERWFLLDQIGQTVFGWSGTRLRYKIIFDATANRLQPKLNMLSDKKLILSLVQLRVIEVSCKSVPIIHLQSLDSFLKNYAKRSRFTHLYDLVHELQWGKATETALENRRKLTPAKKKYVASLQKWKCAHCTEILPARFEVDHLLPWAEGGTDDYSNLQALCPNCHSKKTEKDRQTKEVEKDNFNQNSYIRSPAHPSRLSTQNMWKQCEIDPEDQFDDMIDRNRSLEKVEFASNQQNEHFESFDPLLDFETDDLAELMSTQGENKFEEQEELGIGPHKSNQTKESKLLNCSITTTTSTKNTKTYINSGINDVITIDTDSEEEKANLSEFEEFENQFDQNQFNEIQSYQSEDNEFKDDEFKDDESNENQFCASSQNNFDSRFDSILHDKSDFEINHDHQKTQNNIESRENSENDQLISSISLNQSNNKFLASNSPYKIRSESKNTTRRLSLNIADNIASKFDFEQFIAPGASKPIFNPNSPKRASSNKRKPLVPVNTNIHESLSSPNSPREHKTNKKNLQNASTSSSKTSPYFLPVKPNYCSMVSPVQKEQYDLLKNRLLYSRGEE